jgi:hypothetical protein
MAMKFMSEIQFLISHGSVPLKTKTKVIKAKLPIASSFLLSEMYPRVALVELMKRLMFWI